MIISPAILLHVRTGTLALLLAGAIMVGAGPAASQEAKAWKVDGKVLGKPRNAGEIKSPDDAKKSEDVSGLACAATGLPKVCLIVDDESQGTQVVILKDGEFKAGDFIRLIGNTFDGDPMELDAEGVAYGDGAFYVIGSHGRPRHEQGKKEEKNVARAEATRRVFRIRFAPDAVDTATGRIKTPPDIKDSSALGGIIKAQEKLTPWFDKALQDNGLTVEGVAAQNGKLYVGLRGPMLSGGKAAILQVPISAVFDGQPAGVTLHELDLDKDRQGKPRGVRDLASHKGGFLILAGPVNDPDDDQIQKGDYTLYSWPGTGAELTGRHDLDGYGKAVKPEAVLPLDDKDRTFRALILFDGPDEGQPTPVTIELK